MILSSIALFSCELFPKKIKKKKKEYQMTSTQTLKIQLFYSLQQTQNNNYQKFNT